MGKLNTKNKYYGSQTTHRTNNIITSKCNIYHYLTKPNTSTHVVLYLPVHSTYHFYFQRTTYINLLAPLIFLHTHELVAFYYNQLLSLFSPTLEENLLAYCLHCQLVNKQWRVLKRSARHSALTGQPPSWLSAPPRRRIVCIRLIIRTTISVLQRVSI